MMGPLSSRQSIHDAPWPRGVTFVELLTLIIVILILVSVGVPRARDVIQGIRLRGAAWQLAGDLRLARQRAVTTQRRFRVCLTQCALSVPPGSYSMEVDVGTSGHANWISETTAPVRLPLDVTVSATATPVFMANGMLDPSSGLGTTFTLTGSIGTYEVRVASTGRVRVCQGVCAP